MSSLNQTTAGAVSSVSRLQSATQTSNNCLPAGTRLEDFEITGVIGEGGFGIVYLAFDHALHRTVAIKEYMPGALAWRGDGNGVLLRAEHHRKTFQTGLESFINEARLLAQLDHPALIRVYRYWESNNTGYMAMRYYEGRTLQDVIQNDHASVNCAWLKAIMSDIMEALDTLHGHQILHRDISPENIIILPNGAPVLLDFGAARRIIGNMSQALTVILKPGYAPVEQYADDAEMKQGPWTDVYALCGVMYAAIQKKPPPTSIARMIKDPLAPLHQSNLPAYDPAFLHAIDKGLTVMAEDRPKSMQELRKLIGSLPAAQAIASIPIIPNVAAVADAAPDAPDQEKAPLAASGLVAAYKPRSRQWQMLKKEADSLVAAIRTQIRLLRRSHLMVLGLACLLSIAAVYFTQGDQTSVLSRSDPVASPYAGAARTMDEEAISWTALEKASVVTEEDLARHLRLYPNGRYSELALNMSERIKAQPQQDALPATQPSAAALLPGEEIVAFPVPDAGVSASAESISGQTGTVRLQIKPWAMISVDGNGMGASPPLREIALKEGTHSITLANPAFAAKTMTITITRDKPFHLKHDFYSDKKKEEAR